MLTLVDESNDNYDVVITQEEETIPQTSLRRADIESVSIAGHHHGATAMGGGERWAVVLQLAVQSLGVVFGDIGTSPLYVFSSTFRDGIKNNDDIIGVLSLILYTLTLIPLIKYVMIVLHANDNGDVLSAVGGIKEASYMTQDGVVWISVVILVGLFMVQRFGTDKVGYTFAPIIFIWFIFIAGVGVFNLIKYDPFVIKAINPIYIVDYFIRNKVQAWISLGGVVLAITGTEALFADVGHFSVRSIQLSMCSVTYPALVLAYAGQASFLCKNNESVSDTFYASIPGKLYWPMFVVAVAASIIASQAMISATFSIIQQSLSLGCFPRVKIIHTSTKYPGQVYIPQVNYFLMFACISITLGFRTTADIGNAYGIAVMLVMILTSAFLILVMVVIWKTNTLIVISYVLIIGSVELLYLSSVSYKFKQGGYLPLAFGVVLTMIMFVWNYVERKEYCFELKNQIPHETVKEIVRESTPRLPGLAILYSELELVHGIPPIFKHCIANVSVLHSVLVFVSFKSLPISRVPEDERFLFRRVPPKELRVFRCEVSYGFKDVIGNEENPFEHLLIVRLKEFVRGNENENGDRAVEAEIGDLDGAWRSEVVHVVGKHEVVAKDDASIWKKAIIQYGYKFLKHRMRRNFYRVVEFPKERMLKVGMIYQL